MTSDGPPVCATPTVQGERGRCLCSDACLAGNARAGSECAVLGVSLLGGGHRLVAKVLRSRSLEPRVLWGRSGSREALHFLLG